jgi:hypothetical protein
MAPLSRRIIDELTPASKAELKQSFLEKFSEEWDRVATKSNGLIPTFDHASDEFLSQFGETGNAIIKMREFRQRIQDAGGDYSRLKGLIDLPGASPQKSALTLWSQVSPTVYARFLTKGHFQELGEIQIRVLSPSAKRNVSSTDDKNSVAVDLFTLVADSQSALIQPLSFSALFGPLGILVVPELGASPTLASALLAAILASQVVDWDAFYQMSKLMEEMKDQAFRHLVEQGTIALNKVQDELEKPARELGVIDRKTKNTTKDKKDPTREYRKPGGEEALNKDFDKFPGEATSPEPGVEMKTLPNGNKVVKRLKPSKDDSIPTLEFQPQKTGNKIDDRGRIKIRYPKE